MESCTGARGFARDASTNSRTLKALYSHDEKSYTGSTELDLSKMSGNVDYFGVFGIAMMDAQPICCAF